MPVHPSLQILFYEVTENLSVGLIHVPFAMTET